MNEDTADAIRSATCSDDLLVFAGDESWDVRLMVLNSPYVNGKVLEELTVKGSNIVEHGTVNSLWGDDFDAEVEILQAIAERNDAPAAALRELVGHPLFTTQQVFFNSVTPGDVLHLGTTEHVGWAEEDSRLEVMAASHVNVEPATLEFIARSVDEGWPTGRELAEAAKVSSYQEAEEGPLQVLIAVLVHDQTPDRVRTLARQRIEGMVEHLEFDTFGWEVFTDDMVFQCGRHNAPDPGTLGSFVRWAEALPSRVVAQA